MSALARKNLIDKGALTLTNFFNKNRNVSLLPPATDALPMPLTPNQQLKKEFRCQFHTLYHKKVVLLPSGLLVIDQWLTPRPRALAL